MTKTCPRCSTPKPATEFYIRRERRRSGEPVEYRESRCKECARSRHRRWVERNRPRAQECDRQRNRRVLDRLRARNLWKMYRMTIAEYDVMLAAQGGVCAVCHNPEKSTRKTLRGQTLRLAVDHCHDTGRVRGLLCSNYNRAIGQLQESVAIARSAAEYMEKHAAP